MIVATFPGRLHPKEVYKHDGDIEVIIIFLNNLCWSKLEILNEILLFILVQLSTTSDQSAFYPNAMLQRICPSIMFDVSSVAQRIEKSKLCIQVVDDGAWSRGQSNSKN